MSQPLTRMSVVVPTYYGGEKLERCLRTFCQTHAGKIPYEIFTVLDGGPDPDLVASVSKKYGATFVHLAKNSGCGYANNAGLRATTQSTDCVIVMNDDVWFEEATCLSVYKKLMTNPRIGVAGVRLLYPDGTVQHGGFDARIVHVGRGLPGNAPLVCEDRPTIAVTSALMGISRKLLDIVKGFDVRYRMGYEDVDLCFKARELGWGVHYCGSAWAYHDEGGTRGRVDKLMQNPLWWEWNSSGHNTFFESWSSSRAKFCHDSFTYIVQTDGLTGLKATLGSVLREMSARDEIIVVGPVSSELESLTKGHGWQFQYFQCPDMSLAQKFDLGIGKAVGSYLVFLNAGDVYVDGAVKSMKKEVQASPLRPILCKTATNVGGDTHKVSVPSTDVVAPMILMPNCPDLLGSWQAVSAGDNAALAFLKSTLSKWPPDSAIVRNIVVA